MAFDRFGNDGRTGSEGQVGSGGLSAYEIAVENGFIGTELEWLDSLVGEDGDDGQDGTNGTNGSNGSTGPPGPTAVSTDAGNRAILGSDNLIFVPLYLPVVTALGSAVAISTSGWTQIFSVTVPAGELWEVELKCQFFRASTGASTVYTRIGTYASSSRRPVNSSNQSDSLTCKAIIDNRSSGFGLVVLCEVQSNGSVFTAEPAIPEGTGNATSIITRRLA